MHYKESLNICGPQWRARDPVMGIPVGRGVPEGVRKLMCQISSNIFLSLDFYGSALCATFFT